MANVRRAGESGFTLLEVIVAFTILTLSLGVLLPVFSGSLGRGEQSKHEALALAAGQSKLAGLGIEEPLAVGLSDGEFPDGIHWQLQALPFADATDQKASPLRAYQTTLTMSWRDAGQARSLTLTTLKLAPLGFGP